MRKNSLKILSMTLLLSTLCVAGCSCSKDKENVARITDGDILSPNFCLLDYFHHPFLKHL